MGNNKETNPFVQWCESVADPTENQFCRFGLVELMFNISTDYKLFLKLCIYYLSSLSLWDIRQENYGTEGPMTCREIPHLQSCGLFRPLPLHTGHLTDVFAFTFSLADLTHLFWPVLTHFAIMHFYATQQMYCTHCRYKMRWNHMITHFTFFLRKKKQNNNPIPGKCGFLERISWFGWQMKLVSFLCKR